MRSHNGSLPGLDLSRVVLNPLATMHMEAKGSAVISCFSGRVRACWIKPGEDQAEVQLLDGELVLLPPGTIIEFANLDQFEPAFMTIVEVA